MVIETQCPFLRDSSKGSFRALEQPLQAEDMCVELGKGTTMKQWLHLGRTRPGTPVPSQYPKACTWHRGKF